MALRLSTGLRNRILGISNDLIVTNSSFETDTTGWTNTVGLTRSTSSPPAGQTGYGLLTPSGAAAGEMRYTAAITVSAGQLHRVALKAKWTGTAAGNAVVKIGTTAGASDVFTQTIATTNAWANYETTAFRIPDGTTSVYLTILTSDTTAVNTLGVDVINFHVYGSSIQEIFRKGFLKIYSGSQPASPDNAPSGTLLATIYSDGTTTGVTFADAVAGVLSKSADETWSGTAVATNTAGWYRLVAPGDTAASSTTECRMDGAVATSGAELNMSSTAVTTSAVQTVSTFTITMPAS